MQHWELVPEHDIKTSSQANACVLLAISALSNLFRREAVFVFFCWRNEQMVEQDEEWRFKSKELSVAFLRGCTQTRTHEGEKKKKQGLVGKDKA